MPHRIATKQMHLMAFQFVSQRFRKFRQIPLRTVCRPAECKQGIPGQRARRINVGHVHPYQFPRDRVDRVGGKEVHPFDQGIDRDHAAPITASQLRHIVAQTRRPRRSGQRCKIAGDPVAFTHLVGTPHHSGDVSHHPAPRPTPECAPTPRRACPAGWHRGW